RPPGDLQRPVRVDAVAGLAPREQVAAVDGDVADAVLARVQRVLAGHHAQLPALDGDVAVAADALVDGLHLERTRAGEREGRPGVEGGVELAGTTAGDADHRAAGQLDGHLRGGRHE